MTRQTTEPLTDHRLSASNRTAQEIVRTMYSGGWLLLDPPYQRGSVWTEDQQVALVRSWLSGIPVPGIIINDRMNRDWTARNGRTDDVPFLAVVDGRQRIEAAIKWWSGDLAVPASWFAPESVITTVSTDDGPYVTYAGLTEVAQRVFGNRAMLPIIETKVGSIEEEAALYLLVNGGGTPQTDADMANAAQYATGGEQPTPSA
jgi:hypothetical protein